MKKKNLPYFDIHAENGYSMLLTWQQKDLLLNQPDAFELNKAKATAQPISLATMLSIGLVKASEFPMQICYLENSILILDFSPETGGDIYEEMADNAGFLGRCIKLGETFNKSGYRKIYLGVFVNPKNTQVTPIYELTVGVDTM